ncbi:M24 family metallopeptidase [Chloroflexota bacterium]
MSISGQQALLSKAGLDAMVAVSPQNVNYTIQFKIPSHGVVVGRLVFTLVTKQRSYLIVANMEESTARKYAKVDEVIAYREFEESATNKLAALISELSLAKVGIEQHHISANDYSALKERLETAKLTDCTALFEELRTIKEPWEIDLLTTMAQLASNTHTRIIPIAEIGMSETELWAEIMRLMIRGGAEESAIPCVGFGKRSAFPNAPPTENKLKRGDVVRIDLLFRMKGYHSDICRTTVAQTVTPKQSTMWQNLVEVHKSLLELISPGRESSEVYQMYEQAFHRLGLPVSDFVGHGLGLDLHEPPFVSRFYNNVLEPGMVLCMEPFVFFKDCGYHIEDTILVTETGHKLLSSYDDFEELQIMGK